MRPETEDSEYLAWVAMEKRARGHERDALPNLKGAYGRPWCPSRPGNLPIDDAELLDQLGKARRGTGTKKADREVLATFGEWRGGVILHEARAAGHIVALLRIARTLAQTGRESAYVVTRFACNEYGFHLSVDPADLVDREIQRIAEKASRREDVMSEALMREGDDRRPKKFMVRSKNPEQGDFTRYLK